MKASIPVYNADGSLYVTASAERLVRLQTAGFLARRVYNRKGEIMRAFLRIRPREAKPPGARSIAGTRYYRKERLSQGLVWDLKHLGGAHGGKTYAPPKARAAFFQVVADCTIPEKQSKI
jgi:hypothetical protein